MNWESYAAFLLIYLIVFLSGYRIGALRLAKRTREMISRMRLIHRTQAAASTLKAFQRGILSERARSKQAA